LPEIVLLDTVVLAFLLLRPAPINARLFEMVLPVTFVSPRYSPAVSTTVVETAPPNAAALSEMTLPVRVSLPPRL
jgi:hypothetical protein